MGADGGNDTTTADDMVAYHLRWSGYALTGVVDEQVFGLWYGVGANGKSTMLEVLRHVMGDYAVALDANTLLDSPGSTPHPTGLMGLRGARLATAVEPDSGRRWNESLIKALTGGDAVTARLMRQDYVTFMPTHKLVVSCNAKPLVRDQGRGFWRRLHAVPWGVSFEHRKDLGLKGKLEAEAPGILAMLVLGCRAWQSQGLCPPTAMSEAGAEYQESQDTIGAFLSEQCETGPGYHASRAQLYSAYKQWAMEGGEYCHGKQAFNRIMSERGFGVGKPKGGGDSWLGLRMRAIGPLGLVQPPR
jgi:putative DNA primase/helicase